MTKSIAFSNPGEIDLRLVTSIGVNVKEGGGAIGYFGTGLKYALAVLLREGQSITIYSGLKVCRFGLQEDTIRGKSFQFITMQQDDAEPTLMAFTTEYGKNWTLENAYRELWSNCKDEQGEVFEAKHTLPMADRTLILVSGEKFLDVHLRRWDFLLNPERVALAKVDGVGEILNGKSNKVFYRGIAALTLDREYQYTYNITQEIALSEDRQLPSWETDAALGNLICKSGAKEIIYNALGGRENLESNNSHIRWVNNPCDEFYSAVEALMRNKPIELTENVMITYRRKHPEVIRREAYRPNREEQALLDEAIEFVESIGFGVTQYPIGCFESLGERVLAMAEGEKILLSRKVLRTNDLVVALIEEFVHIRHGVRDYTLEMQNHLFAEIERLGRELRAERRGQGQWIEDEYQASLPSPFDPVTEDEIPF